VVAKPVRAAYDRRVLCGRDRERDRIGELLKAARASRSGALVLRGEPGVGKTALLEDTQDRATDMHVLRARGVESEAELPFAALHQLLRTGLGHLDRIPAPQAEALQAALGLTQSSGHERFLVSAACLSLLSELAERRPVLCLIDDAHWLDQASAEALLFVARRVDAEGIVMLFSAREGETKTFDARDVDSLVVEGLDAASSASLLAQSAGSEVAAVVAERLVEQTRGNALALLEVPSVLTPEQLAGQEPLPNALPLTGHVETIFLERVRRLPDQTQHLLLVAAADDSEDLRLVLDAARAGGADAESLDAAEREGLVSVHGTRLEFRHPLVRSAVYDGATSGQRRSAHAALAAVLDDSEDADRRAWHLASSVVGPDEEIAQVVEEAAARAEARAGYGAAAKAFERAADLSSNGTARARRLVAAARAASTAGADDRAAALATKAQAHADSPEQRADIACALGLAALRRGNPMEVFGSLMDAARDVSAINPRRALEALLYAYSGASQAADVGAQAAAAKLVESIQLSPDDHEAIVVAGCLRGFAAEVQGDYAAAASLLEPARQWAPTANDSYSALMTSIAVLWFGDHAQYSMLLNRVISMARTRGEIGTLAEILSIRAAQLGYAQRFDEATLAAAEALEFAAEIGAENFRLLPLIVLAVVAAIRGDEEEAHRYSDETVQLATAHGLRQRVGYAHYAKALVEVGRGRWAEALELLDAAVRENPTVVQATRLALDRVEAAVHVGRTEDAQNVLASFEEWCRRSSAPWALPRLACCRALAADDGEAGEHYEEALRSADDAWPFDLARIQLLYGEHLRRERRRADARTQLRAAHEAFERMRAMPWADRAAAELRATGETARKRDPSTFDRLTPQEIQISRLVAEGLSNKEVAAQLFLSPRTIDYHLRNVFAKLGLTSRTQLARVSLGDEVPVGETAGALA
jgi:ATP/maltotriose-dependent transcriptional regulator MalT